MRGARTGEGGAQGVPSQAIGGGFGVAAGVDRRP